METQEYHTTVHPFGVGSSSFLVNHTSLKTAELFGINNGEAKTAAIRSSFYVGGCLRTFAMDIEVATLARDVIELPARGNLTSEVDLQIAKAISDICRLGCQRCFGATRVDRTGIGQRTKSIL